MSTRIARPAAALVLASTLVGGAQTAYGFDPGGGGTSGGSGSTSSSGSGSSGNGALGAGSDGGRTGNVGNCLVVSSSSYLGLSCGSASAGDGPSIKEILDGDKLPTVWYEKLTAAELDAVGKVNTPTSTWYWERRLKGIDPKTFTIGPDGIQFETGLVALPNDKPVKSLTTNQQALVDYADSSNAQIPTPVAVVSPAAHPRVGAWLSFFDGTPTQVSVDAGGASMRAHVVTFSVLPEGVGGPKVECAGAGYKARPGDTPQNHPEGCWHKYAKSSVAEPNQQYQALTRTHWVVEVRKGNGDWEPFDSFTKDQVTTIPVTEIQSLVVN